MPTFSGRIVNRQIKAEVFQMPLTLKNPPINEVVVASYFNPPLAKLRSEHIGLFWEKIKDDFPTVRQQVPANVREDIIPNDVFPMPRYWFIGSDEINLIQIQKSAFMFNWRRRNGHTYPRFHKHIKPTFDKYYGVFDQFIRTEVSRDELVIDLCELTYVNTLERCEFWEGPQDTKKVIRSFSITDPGLSTSGQPGFDCKYLHKVSRDLELNINVRSGVNPQQSNAPILVFEIRASGRIGGVTKTGSDQWFQRAHDSINACFKHITSLDVQKNHWGLLEDSQ